jgi:iron complex transport system substrate-binding protein
VSEAVAECARPRVLALEWLDPPFVGGHWVPEMIQIAGGTNVIGEAGARSREVTWADLDRTDPDVVVVMPCGWYVDQARRETLAHREQIGALGPSRVFAVDAASSFSRPGPRLVEGTELLAHLLHPDAIDAPATVCFAEVQATAAA